MKYLALVFLTLLVSFSFYQRDKVELNEICYTNNKGKIESFLPYAYNSNVVLKFNEDVTVQVFYKQFPIVKRKIEDGLEKVTTQKTKLCEIDPMTVIVKKDGRRFISDFSAQIEVFAQSGDLLLYFPELVDTNEPNKKKEATSIKIEDDCIPKFLNMLSYEYKKEQN
ncbi:MAG: hypothetical protein JXQ87_04685 [Bacteroidia bacterium]